MFKVFKYFVNIIWGILNLILAGYLMAFINNKYLVELGTPEITIFHSVMIIMFLSIATVFKTVANFSGILNITERLKEITKSEYQLEDDEKDYGLSFTLRNIVLTITLTVSYGLIYLYSFILN